LLCSPRNICNVPCGSISISLEQCSQKIYILAPHTLIDPFLDESLHLSHFGRININGHLNLSRLLQPQDAFDGVSPPTAMRAQTTQFIRLGRPRFRVRGHDCKALYFAL
jgi:hypothetical protein